MRTVGPAEATGDAPLRTIAAIVRSGGARVRTGGAGGVAVSSGEAGRNVEFE